MLQQHRQIHRKNKSDTTGAPIIDHFVVPHRMKVLVITGDRPDEAADWVNIDNIATEQHKTFHLIVFKVVPI